MKPSELKNSEESTPHNLPECGLWGAVIERLRADLNHDADGMRLSALRDMRTQRAHIRTIVFDMCGLSSGAAEKVWEELCALAEKADDEYSPCPIDDQWWRRDLWSAMHERMLVVHAHYMTMPRNPFAGTTLFSQAYKKFGFTRGEVWRYMHERRVRGLPPLPRRQDDRIPGQAWSPWIFYSPKKGRGGVRRGENNGN